MFRIENSSSGAGPRLIAPDGLSRDDFRRIAEELGISPFRARKSGFVAARRTDQLERVETRWNGKETVASAEPGDWIATNMGPDAAPLRDGAGNLNVYVIKADRFPQLYERVASETVGGNERDRIFRPRGSVAAVFLAGGLEIKAPWGETQRADAAYLLDNGSEVYGNAKETFEATYRRE